MLMQKTGEIATTKAVMPIPAGMPEVTALADYFYKVVKGAVKTYKLLNDGRRQISAFHLVGDIFGLEAGKEHRFTADAIADSTVLVIKRTTVMTLASRDSEIANGLWAQAT